MFILEDLWNGELAPCERRFREGVHKPELPWV